MQTAQLWYSTTVGRTQLWTSSIVLHVIAQLWSSTALRAAQLWSSSVVLQLSYEAAQLWDEPGASRPWGQAPVWPNSSPRSSLFDSVQSLGCFTLWWKGKVCSLNQRADLYRQKSLPLLPNWSPNPHSMTGPKGTVWVGQNGATLICQWKCWCGYSRTAPIRWGKPQYYWLKYNSRNSFISAGSVARTQCSQTVQCRRLALVQASPCSVACMRGPFRNGLVFFVCFVLIWAQSATRSPW